MLASASILKACDGIVVFPFMALLSLSTFAGTIPPCADNAASLARLRSIADVDKSPFEGGDASIRAVDFALTG
jgi:hypothetical protein